MQRVLEWDRVERKPLRGCGHGVGACYAGGMDFKLREIALIVVAIAVPVTVLALAFIPGGLGFIFRLAMDPLWGPVIFFGGAGAVMLVLGWRFYRRIRPAEKKQAPASTHVSPAKMPKVEGSDAARRHRDGEG